MLLRVGWNPNLFSRETDSSQESCIDLAQIKHLEREESRGDFEVASVA